MNKQDYQNQLTNHICQVTFTKKDGTERVMKCTTKSEYVNELNQTTTKTRHVPDNQVCVIDVEKKEWRSFVIESVKEFIVIE